METTKTLEQFIQSLKRSTVTLEELEALFNHERIDWQEFAEAIHRLESEKVFEAIRSSGRTIKQPSLAYRYRVNKHLITTADRNQLNQEQLTYHHEIQLDEYYTLPLQVYEQDKRWIKRIDNYLKQNGFPTASVPAPERSFELVGNEKWISELGGQAVLKRIGLWDRLLIYPVSDPLMMAFNPTAIDASTKQLHTHLIVENKTTFQALLPALSDSGLRTLIYGCGNKITGNMDMFSMQYPVIDGEHQFFYFGDLDFEGIRIWYELSKQRPIKPALVFYEALLERPYVIGKHNQRRDEPSVQAFLLHFSPAQRERIEHCLSSGGYYPQETLTTLQLQRLWGSEQWKQWIGMN